MKMTAAPLAAPAIDLAYAPVTTGPSARITSSSVIGYTPGLRVRDEPTLPHCETCKAPPWNQLEGCTVAGFRMR